MRRNIIMLVTTVTIIVATFVATLLSDNRPVLGLDLQGGVSIVLFPVKGSDTAALDTAVTIIRNRVDGLGIAEPEVNRQGNTIVIDLPGVKDRQKAEDLVGQTAELRFREVQGFVPVGPATTTTTNPKSKKKATTTTAPKTSSTAPGATTPTTAPAESPTTKKALGARGINAQLISASRPAQAATTTPATTPPTSGAGATPTTVAGATPTSVAGATTTTAPRPKTCADVATPRAKQQADQPVILPGAGSDPQCYALGPTILTGKNVSGAAARYDSTSGWLVDVTFRTNDFVTKVAGPMVGKNVAIELDGVVESAPTINPGITGKKVQISGRFSEKDAHNLALVLKYGALPIQFDQNEQTVSSVSPSLGKDQLHAGIVAGLIGLALVALYMILYYRILGVVVWVGLGLTAMTFFTLVSFLSAHSGLTLTLAGVTGIIVSVGVTVDSYVVYFERLKDEVRSGKTVRSSLDGGFRRAFRTIWAADLVSLLGAVVLYELATGSVRGFAFFLGISTLLDLLLAYTFMHPMVVLLARQRRFVNMPYVGIASALDVPEAIA